MSALARIADSLGTSQDVAEVREADYLITVAKRLARRDLAMGRFQRSDIELGEHWKRLDGIAQAAPGRDRKSSLPQIRWNELKFRIRIII